jgi:hypothetical protein
VNQFGRLAMIFYHRDPQIELDDAWWIQGRMAGPRVRAYRVDVAAAKGQIFEARIESDPPSLIQSSRTSKGDPIRLV